MSAARPISSRRAASALLGFALAAAPAWALDWENRELSVRVAPLQAEVAVEFSFLNSGDQPVAIAEIRTNCDCLAAESDRPRYAPGERGVIKARFTTGDRLGLYERSILVVTDEGGDPARLAVKVDVPAPAEASPRTVDWRVNAAAEPRAIELAVAPELAIDFTSAVSTGAGFDVRLEPVEAGRRYRVVVMPKSTAERTSAAIRIRGTERAGREVTISAYAYVR